jgi:predicted TIM-barrel fold metal-dependent hydrolase
MTSLPKELLDAHHHFLDVKSNSFQSFLGTIVPGEVYLPTDYGRDVVEPLKKAGISIAGSVHVECMPDNGPAEAAWVDSITSSSTVKAIVGSCDLSQPSIDEDLEQLKQASPKVRGVRWILDCVGKFEPGTATHIATSRHDGIDYLRGSNGGYNGGVIPDFERGFSFLEKHGLSFDLQCAPAQLAQAAMLFAKYPKVKVCIDHLGKPMTLLGPDVESNMSNTIPDDSKLLEWKKGMQLMATLPNVYVKLSMMGFAVPGWTKTPKRTAMVRDLVQEIVRMFGPRRCMVATNWWKSAALSDADGLSNVGPTPVELVTYFAEFLSDYSKHERDQVFCGTAREFYNI